MDEIPSGLNGLQQRFVDEYLIDLDANAAAQRAGYEGPNAGRQLLTYPYVMAAIDKAKRQRALRTMITAERVLEELAKIAFADIRNVMKWGEVETVVSSEDVPEVDGVMVTTRVRDAVRLTPSDEIDEHTSAAIAEISETKDGIRLKMYDKQAALVNLGKHLGLFKDTLDVNAKVSAAVAVGVKNLDMETFKRAAKELLQNV